MPGSENGKRKAGKQCWDFPGDNITVLLKFINAQYFQVIGNMSFFFFFGSGRAKTDADDELQHLGKLM